MSFVLSYCTGLTRRHLRAVPLPHSLPQASWHIHKFIAEKHGDTSVGGVPALPRFYTAVDLVDLSTEVCGVRFPNPFGYVCLCVYGSLLSHLCLLLLK